MMTNLKTFIPVFFILLIYCGPMLGQTKIDTIPTEYVTWNGKKYAFVRHVKPNWHKAQNICSILKMQLAKIESEAENHFIVGTAFSKEGMKATDGLQYWIGANDIDEEGQWVWSKNNTMFYDQNTQTAINGSYENWGKTTLGSQPNNVLKNDEDEDCVVIRKNGDWYDIGCNTRYAYVICECEDEE